MNSRSNGYLLFSHVFEHHVDVQIKPFQSSNELPLVFQNNLVCTMNKTHKYHTTNE